MKIQIKTTRLAVYAIIIFSLVTAASLVYAGDNIGAAGKVFAGIKYGNQDIEMQTQFTRRTDGVITEQSSFNNQYTANAGGLLVGYTLPWERFYLSGQVFFDVFDKEFDLSTGSSRITNALNYAFGIDLMPGVYLFRGLSVFGKLGLANGDFDFVKSSPKSTNYDADRNLFGYTLGFGLAYDITPRFTAKIGYEQTQYEDTEINATLGTRSDHTVVKPEVESFFIVLQYNFN